MSPETAVAIGDDDDGDVLSEENEWGVWRIYRYRVVVCIDIFSLYC